MVGLLVASPIFAFLAKRKTVHFIDLLTADGVPYHKSCFKCSHCRGTLSMCNYSSMDGVLYCKPHFEQLYKETGNFTKKFYNPIKSAEKLELNRTPSKISQMFSGTQDKCAVCKKTAYPLEKLTMDGESYHKTCFKCSHGGCTLTPSSFNPFRLIGAGLSIWTFAAAGCGCAINFWMIKIFRMLVGVGEASFISLAAPFIDDDAPVSQVIKELHSVEMLLKFAGVVKV